MDYCGLSLCTIMACMDYCYGLYELLLWTIWTTMDSMDIIELYGYLVCLRIWFEMNMVYICRCYIFISYLCKD
jgi:hypothetical protein